MGILASGKGIEKLLIRLKKEEEAEENRIKVLVKGREYEPKYRGD